ncbi:MAG: Ribosomal RNA large subunit methyltransferase E [Candidatus Heimdallarchaeota archaeon AB_125]|nr:MAG: Ribosomal RNA large subunit methyltransferase E [Candidatus Heimdallarchaeota archaeon AB_125]
MITLSADPYAKKARASGFRSRAAYKLFEINDKFVIFKKGQQIIDLGASPGGWSQVASRKIGSNGLVIAIDKAYIQEFKEKNIVIEFQDIFKKDLDTFLLENYGKSDVLISDCAPNISGNYDQDHSIQSMLAQRAFELSQCVLYMGGSFVCKIFQGSETQEFVKSVKERFRTVKLFKPKSSRKQSSEIYLIARDFISDSE